MKTIYILLTRSNTILSRIVHLITADTYTHASISFNENLQPLYSSARKNGRTLFPAGPCTEHFHKGYFQRHPMTPCALYKLQVEDEAFYRAKVCAEQIMENSDHYGFNIIGLILCQLQIPFHRKGHYFCSQLVGEILYKSNAIDLPKDVTIMKPSDYTKISELVCLFEGQINDLVDTNVYSIFA